MRRYFALVSATAFAIVVLLVSPLAYAEEKAELSMSRQPGILYLPTHVMEKLHLIEANAARLGVPDLKVRWLSFSGGGNQTDALLSGAVDIVNTGFGNLLLLWDRTKGGVKGIVATSVQPVLLISRDPRILSLKDIGPGDKIAVPTVKVSVQAILIQMAASAIYGPDQWAKLDVNTIQLGHPDAAAALANPSHELRNHFSAPPFQYSELASVPGAHVIARSTDIIGGPLTQGTFFTTTRYADANPKVIEAVRAAAQEAQDFIFKDPRAALEIYREITGDRTSTENMLAMLKEPEMMSYTLAPQGTMKVADHLVRVGIMRTQPKSWKDYYLPIAHDLPGN